MREARDAWGVWSQDAARLLFATLPS